MNYQKERNFMSIRSRPKSSDIGLWTCSVRGSISRAIKSTPVSSRHIWSSKLPSQAFCRNHLGAQLNSFEYIISLPFLFSLALLSFLSRSLALSLYRAKEIPGDGATKAPEDGSATATATATWGSWGDAAWPFPSWAAPGKSQKDFIFWSILSYWWCGQCEVDSVMGSFFLPPPQSQKYIYIYIFLGWMIVSSPVFVNWNGFIAFNPRK